MSDWKTDGWKFTGNMGTIHETRHEAVGEAAIEARQRREARHGPTAPDGTYCGPTVAEATAWVYSFKPFRCGYCGETFLTEAEHEEHKTCPVWEDDQPIPPEGGSNPLAAAHMDRRIR